MAVTKERFEQGMTYDEYKAQMTRNRERFDANEADARDQFGPTWPAFARLPTAAQRAGVRPRTGAAT